MASNGKSEYRTFDKFLEDKGLFKRKLSKSELDKYHSEYLQSKPWLKNYLKNTNGNGENKNVNSENNTNPAPPNNAFNQDPSIKPAIPFNASHVKQIIAFDKGREELKKNEKKADPGKKTEYHQFEPKVDKEKEKESETQQQELSEEELAKQKFDQDWAWLDGTTVIHFMDQINLRIVPLMCERKGKQCPTPEQIIYKEKARLLMKPGMDKVADQIKHLFKNPLYLAIAVAAYQPIMCVATAPKIPEYNGFSQTDNQDQSPQ